MSANEGVVVRNDGDVAATLAGAATKLDAIYQVPFLAHTTMEPMNCTVHVRKDGCDVWVGIQVLARAQAVAAQITGLPRIRSRSIITCSAAASGGGSKSTSSLRR